MVNKNSTTDHTNARKKMKQVPNSSLFPKRSVCVRNESQYSLTVRVVRHDFNEGLEHKPEKIYTGVNVFQEGWEYEKPEQRPAMPLHLFYLPPMKNDSHHQTRWIDKSITAQVLVYRGDENEDPLVIAIGDSGRIVIEDTSFSPFDLTTIQDSDLPDSPVDRPIVVSTTAAMSTNTTVEVKSATVSSKNQDAHTVEAAPPRTLTRSVYQLRPLPRLPTDIPSADSPHCHVTTLHRVRDNLWASATPALSNPSTTSRIQRSRSLSNCSFTSDAEPDTGSLSPPSPLVLYVRFPSHRQVTWATPLVSAEQEPSVATTPLMNAHSPRMPASTPTCEEYFQSPSPVCVASQLVTLSLPDTHYELNQYAPNPCRAQSPERRSRSPLNPGASVRATSPHTRTQTAAPSTRQPAGPSHRRYTPGMNSSLKSALELMLEEFR